MNTATTETHDEKDGQDTPTTAAPGVVRWKHPWRLLLVSLCLLALFAMSVVRLSERSVMQSQKADVRAELERDFPGFVWDKTDHFSVPGGWDSDGQSGFRFQMHYAAAPAFKIRGMYAVTGITADSGRQPATFSETIFNRKRFSDAELAAFAAEWLKHYPDQAIVFGPAIGSSITAAEWGPQDEALYGAIKERADPRSVYGFQSDETRVMTWFAFDPASHQWTYLGDRSELVK